MDQDFKPHPVLNYASSRDGVVRSRRIKKPVGFLINHGYLMFGAGGKKYLCHIIIFECHNGLIKSGLMIDHIDSNPKNNSLKNIQAVTQSENTQMGKTGKH